MLYTNLIISMPALTPPPHHSSHPGLHAQDSDSYPLKHHPSSLHFHPQAHPPSHRAAA